MTIQARCNPVCPGRRRGWPPFVAPLLRIGCLTWGALRTGLGNQGGCGLTNGAGWVASDPTRNHIMHQFRDTRWLAAGQSASRCVRIVELGPLSGKDGNRVKRYNDRRGLGKVRVSASCSVNDRPAQVSEKDSAFSLHRIYGCATAGGDRDGSMWQCALLGRAMIRLGHEERALIKNGNDYRIPAQAAVA